MSKTLRIVLGLVGLLLAAGALFYLFDPDARLKGALRGDPWYDGRPATAWHDDLAGPDEITQSLAAQKLRDPAAIPVLEHLLKSDGPAAPRWYAADVLGQIGTPARAAGPALVAALHDPNPTVRRVAVQSVGKLAPDVPGAVPALVELFPDVEAVRAIAEFKAAGADAVPKLIVLLDDPDPAVRRNTCRTLGRIGEAAKAAVPALTTRLTDPDPPVREYAAKALGWIGPPAASAIPELVKQLADPEPVAREGAVQALGDLGPAAKGELAKVQALKADPDKRVQAAAARAERLIDPSLSKGTPGRDPKRE
jgi:HEAT repeat protein